MKEMSLQLGQDTPRTGEAGTVEGSGTVVGTAIEAVAGQGHIGVDDRHTFGAVHSVVIIAGSVPADESGGHEVEFVIGGQSGIPTRTLQVKVANFTHVDAAISKVSRDAEGIEHGQFAGDASPPGVAVIVVAADHEISSTSGKQAIGHTVQVISTTTKLGVLTNDAVHAEGSHLHTVEGQRNSQPHNIHGVMNVMIGIILIVRTQPEERSTDIFGELARHGDTSAVSVQNGHRHSKGRHAKGLQAHTNLSGGLGNDPVNIAVADTSLPCRRYRERHRKLFHPSSDGRFRRRRRPSGFRRRSRRSGYADG